MPKTLVADIHKEKEVNIDEIGKSGIVAEPTVNVNIDEEAFANEILTVRVATSTMDPHPVPTQVNGISQYFIRGKPQKVKRKYVEALLHSIMVKYETKELNPRDPHDVRQIERKALTYPFEIIHDPNPKGQEWFERMIHSA